MPLSLRVTNNITNLIVTLQEADEQLAAVAMQLQAVTCERDELLALLPDDVRAAREKRTNGAADPIVGAPTVEGLPAGLRVVGESYPESGA